MGVFEIFKCANGTKFHKASRTNLDEKIKSKTIPLV